MPATRLKVSIAAPYAALAIARFLQRPSDADYVPHTRCSDCNPETHLHEAIPLWPDNSPIPVSVEMIIAACWIVLVSCIPLALRRMDTRPITKTSIAMFLVLWTSILGGLYIFTNVITFNSSHFKTQRSLTIVECIYFMSQVIMTVGYGDITPAEDDGRLFVALYVLASIFVLGMMVSEVVARIEERMKNYTASIAEKVISTDATLLDELGELHLITAAMKPPSTTKFVQALMLFGCIQLVWITFFANYPGEKKTLLDAVYMSVITLSTVGFGAVTPLTEGGKVFGAFFMILGGGALVNVVTEFATMMMQFTAYERHLKQKQLMLDDDHSVLTEFRKRCDDPANFTEADFVAYGLVQTGSLSQNDAIRIRMAWKALLATSEFQRSGKDAVGMTPQFAGASLHVDAAAKAIRVLSEKSAKELKRADNGNESGDEE